MGIIIVAQPGRMLTGFRVLLRSSFPTQSIETSEDFSSVRTRLAEDLPLLVLIDASLPADAWRVGAEAQRQFPRHHFVILAHDHHQYDRACAAGQQALLLEGMTADLLLDAFRVFRTD
jgi:DNA-binding NarL/FixJ family response regulator